MANKKKTKTYCLKIRHFPAGFIEIHLLDTFQGVVTQGFHHSFDYCNLEDFITLFGIYLHNEYGPALISQYNLSVPIYWINGQSFKNKEEWELATNHFKFPNKLDRILL